MEARLSSELHVRSVLETGQEGTKRTYVFQLSNLQITGFIIAGTAKRREERIR